MGDGMICHFHKYSVFLLKKKIKNKNKEAEREREREKAHAWWGLMRAHETHRGLPPHSLSVFTSLSSPLLFSFCFFLLFGFSNLHPIPPPFQVVIYPIDIHRHPSCFGVSSLFLIPCLSPPPFP